MKSVFIAVFAGMVGFTFVQPVLEADAVTFKETVLYSFGNGTDGQYPEASLIALNGILYGTTTSGGTYSGGTVFALEPSTGAEEVLYAFCGQGGCSDGVYPYAGLLDVKGKLYGTTSEGGTGQGRCGLSCGTVFTLHYRTGAETVLYSFCSQQSCPDGATPLANLSYANGKIYGTTDMGGAQSLGTVFALDRQTGAETVLYSFCSQQNCTDGANPQSRLINVNGILYGTTVIGGTPGNGTVFSLDPESGAEEVLHSFQNSADGWQPRAGVIDVGGVLYGTTENGGRAGHGAVFSFDLSTALETMLYSFMGGKDGVSPLTSLIEVKGKLYGTTIWGGGTGCNGIGCGTVFSIDPTTGAEKVLYSFCSQQNCSDGANPQASLINVDGKLYGTTTSGGAYNGGTVFELEKIF